MPYQYVTAGYSASDLILALIIYFKAPRSTTNKFYLFLVFSMLVLGGCAFVVQTISSSALLIWSAEAVASFLFSVFPFFFLHFMVVLVRREDLLGSKIVILFIYFAGLFSYTIQLIGLLPKPISSSTGFTNIGFIFFVTWMSILFSVGVAILFTFLKGFSDKGVRSNIIVSGFAFLLFFLPGPFSESIFVALGPGRSEWYLISSLFALVFALYFVFRHKIIVNTVYDLMKSALDVMSDIFLRMDEDLFIQMVRGASQTVLGYSEKELLGRNLAEIVISPEPLIDYKTGVLSGGKKDLNADTEMLARDGKKVPVSLSLTPVIDTGKLVGFAGVGRDFTEKRNAERLQNAISKIFEVTPHVQNLHDLGKEIYSILKTVMNVENFYIALKDEATGEMNFPYFIDRYYKYPEQGAALYTLTKQVIHEGQPALLTSFGHDHGLSKYPTTWLGVPLKTTKGIFGVIAVYTYSISTTIGEREKGILTLFSQQASAILERKHADMKVQEQAALLDEVMDAIILESLDGQILYCNRAAGKIYGFEPSAVIGRNSYDLLRTEPPEAVFKARDNLLEKNRWSGELKFFKKKGRICYGRQ
ncbi:MAG: PAS domain S-box protein [Candidatus Kryptoniota bacterium]